MIDLSSLPELAAKTWDCIVVGAGPAGGLAADELARRGLSVLLVDKAAFPRWKVCGSCLNGRAVSMLRAAGMGDTLARLGAVPLESLYICAESRHATIPLIPGGLALSRQALDAALIESAVARGAVFLPGTDVRLGNANTTDREVRLRRGPVNVLARARIVLAADGLAGTVSTGVRRNTGRYGQSRVGLGTVLDSAPASYGTSTIFMGCTRDGYVGLVRLEDGRVGVAAAVNPSVLQRAGNPCIVAKSLLEQAGLPRIDRFDQARWRGTPALTAMSNVWGGERVLLLGDSAGFVEPFTGEGIAWALAAAHAVVPFALQAVSRWRPDLVHAWGEAFLKTVADRQGLCRLLARILRYPLLTRLLIQTLGGAPWLARPVLRQLNLGPA